MAANPIRFRRDENNVPAGGGIQRHLAPFDNWKRYKPIIKHVNQCLKWPLKKTQKFLFDRFMFLAPDKQWKEKMKDWGLRVNMNEPDAACMLWLMKDAEEKGIEREVYYCCNKKTKEDITKYLLRHKKGIRTDEELLRRHPPGGEKPEYITFYDGEEIRLRNIHMPGVCGKCGYDSAALSDSSKSDLSLESLRDYVHVGKDLVMEKHNDRHAEDAKRRDAEQDDDDTSITIKTVKHLASSFEKVSKEASGATDEVLGAILGPMGFLTSKTADYAKLASFNVLLSSSPGRLDLGEQAPHQNLRESRALVLAQLREAIFGQKQTPAEDTFTTPMYNFLAHCISWCVLDGQGFAENEDDELFEASLQFGMILRNDPSRSVTVVFTLRSLLDAYGESKRAKKITQICRDASESVSTELLREISILPVNFAAAHLMLNFLNDIPETSNAKWAKEKVDWRNYLQNTLEQHQQQQQLNQQQWPGTDYPLDAELMMNLQYFVGWLQLETGLIDDGLRTLHALRDSAEDLLGLESFLTISCMGVIARVLTTKPSTRQKKRRAEAIMRETVVSRVEKTFSPCHPYYWEVKHRHALYMTDLASDQGTEEEERNKLNKVAESIFRETLLWRYTILGSSNTKTQQSFQRMQRFLWKQNRNEEATNIAQWCKEMSERDNILLQGQK